jgi:hypothetical protein
MKHDDAKHDGMRADGTKHDGVSQEELAHEADAVRSRLMRAVEELDRRRHEVLHPAAVLIPAHTRGLAIAAGALLVAGGLGGGFLLYRARTAPRRRWHQRWALAGAMWRHPERAMHGQQRPLWEDALRSALTSLLVAAITIPAKRMLTDLLEKHPVPS